MRTATLVPAWALWLSGGDGGKRRRPCRSRHRSIHDQAVIECPADEYVLNRKAEIERLMIEGMLTVVPGMNVKVEAVVSRSLNKSELDDRYFEAAAN